MNRLQYKRILIISDAYVGNASGAGVTQIIVGIIKSMQGEVAIYGTDVENGHDDMATLYQAPSAPAIANYFKSKYRKQFVKVLEDFKPTNVFFVGSITNKPLVYIEESLKRGMHTDVFIFMQDFFCAKFYANDSNAPCTLCLDRGLSHLFKCKCSASRMYFTQKVVRWDIRRRLKKLLPLVDHVLTSTEEQCDFYHRFGVAQEKTYITPLPFTTSKLYNYSHSCGDYYIGIAQNREEKGFQFIPQILEYLEGNNRIVLAFYCDADIMKYRVNNKIEKYLKSGKLVLVVKSWSTGLGDLIASARGVIIPSIWPTTTEFGLLEALGLHKPIFAFNISIHKEVVGKYYPQNLFEIGDFNTFGKRLSTYTEEDYSIDSSKSFEMFQQFTNVNRWEEDFYIILK